MINNDKMHHYTQVNLSIIPFEEYLSDILASSLGEIGFESFEVIDNQLIAYIQTEMFDVKELNNIMIDFPFDAQITYTTEEVASVNWNEEWEKHYFEPILINNQCVIHSSFHQNIPQAEFDIVIDPKMSFGTGHHETTSLMIAWILKMELEGKMVLDMGCGTAVLAILAAKRGAGKLLAIDIDPWCTENSAENIVKNDVPYIQIQTGGAELLVGLQFDIVIANINRNILLNDMKAYTNCLSSGGELYMSGFYVEDIPMIQAEAEKNGMKFIGYEEKNRWVAVKTVKV